jgi:hypothetical protein
MRNPVQEGMEHARGAHAIWLRGSNPRALSCIYIQAIRIAVVIVQQLEQILVDKRWQPLFLYYLGGRELLSCSTPEKDHTWAIGSSRLRSKIRHAHVVA